MRVILALGLLIAFCASADAAAAQHRRHGAVSPNQRAISGFAYAPNALVVHDQFESTRPSIYDNKYAGWGG